MTEAMSGEGPPRDANSAPSGGSAAANAASVGALSPPQFASDNKPGICPEAWRAPTDLTGVIQERVACPFT